MNPEDILRAIFNYGFPSVMLLMVSYGAWKLVNDILKHNKEREQLIILNNKERENALMSLIQNEISTMNKTLLMSLEHIVEFRKINDEAHRYQREEHKDISDLINGDNKDILERLDSLKNNNHK